jgi:hypothetical protein
MAPANFMAGPLILGYNVYMSFEDDETSAVSDQQPHEAEDQFEEDLMRDLEQQQSSPSH